MTIFLNSNNKLNKFIRDNNHFEICQIFNSIQSFEKGLKVSFVEKCDRNRGVKNDVYE